MQKQHKKTSNLFETSFGVSSFLEHFDRPAAVYVRDHLLTDAECGVDEKKLHMRDMVVARLDESKGKDYLEIVYKKGEFSGQMGRWFAGGKSPMQRMPRKLRHTLCKDLWYDLDFKNCHPVIVLQICQKNNIPCHELQRYVEHREEILQEVVDSVGSDKFLREDAKEAVLKMLNGGNVSELDMAVWGGLQRHFRQIASEISNLSVYKDIRDVAMRNPDVRLSGNRDAKIMNAIACFEENRNLEALYWRMTRAIGLQRMCVFMFDGLQVRRTEETTRVIESKGFFEETSEIIAAETGFHLEIVVKEFDEGFDLPANYKECEPKLYVIPADSDKTAAELVIEEYKGEIVRDGDRVLVKKDGIYEEPSVRDVQGAIANKVSKMNIMMDSPFGLKAYSSNDRHTRACANMVLHHDGICDNNFIANMSHVNVGYMRFSDGVYSLTIREFLGESEIPFMCAVPHPFPKSNDEKVRDELISRVLHPVFGNKERLEYYLYCVARAIAGDVSDKVWYVMWGERNSGKGVCNLLIEKSFAGYITAFNAQSLVTKKFDNNDSALKLSWLSDWDCKRIAIANECQNANSKTKLDGNMIKQIASGGDKMQIRKLYGQEQSKTLQTTFMLNFNDSMEIDPPDAFETVRVFKFPNKFIQSDEFDKLDPRSILPHWKKADDGIKGWIGKDRSVQDAFVRMVFEAYTTNGYEMPRCVKEDTLKFKGSEATDLCVRLAEVLEYDSHSFKSGVFFSEIRESFKLAGMPDMSDTKIEELASRIFSDKTPRVEAKRISISGKRGYGLRHVRINRYYAPPENNSDRPSYMG